MWKHVEFRYLDHEQVHACRPSACELMDLIEVCYQDRASGGAQVPPKTRIAPRKGVFVHAKPGYVPSMDVAGIKWQSNVPENPDRGLPNNIGLVVLTDPETGVPRAVMDCTWITALRTPAASMVAIKRLARSGARQVGIVGLGLQGRCHFDALIESAVLPNLETVRFYDLNPVATAAFEAHASGKANLEIRPCSTPKDALKDADVMISCTLFQRPDPTVVPDWIKPGALCLPVDLGAYWSAESRASVDLIATDDEPQTQSFAHADFFPEDKLRIDVEMAEIVSGKHPGRENDDQRIMCINAGLSTYDIAMAERVLEKAAREGVGTVLQW